MAGAPVVRLPHCQTLRLPPRRTRSVRKSQPTCLVCVESDGTAWTRKGRFLLVLRPASGRYESAILFRLPVGLLVAKIDHRRDSVTRFVSREKQTEDDTLPSPHRYQKRDPEFRMAAHPDHLPPLIRKPLKSVQDDSILQCQLRRASCVLNGVMNFLC